MFKYFLIFSAIGIATAQAGCPSDKPWEVRFSQNMPSCLRALDSFKFGEPHYITKKSQPIKIGQVISITFTIEGTGVIVPTEGAPPPKLRILMQQKGDTLTASEEDKRWWSAPIELKPGTYTLSSKVDPALWSQVFGKYGNTRPEKFKKAIANLGNVGFTFGGNFAGHGIKPKSGTVRFVLKEFKVQ